MNKVKRYIKACHTRKRQNPNIYVYGRIPADYAPIQDLSINIKHMPTAFGGYKYLLDNTCDQTNLPLSPLLEVEMHNQ